MKNNIFSLSFTLLLSTVALTAMDLEDGASHKDLTTIALEETPLLEQFKIAFNDNTTTENLLQELQRFKYQPQALCAIKNWLKDQRINNDQNLVFFSSDGTLALFQFMLFFLNVSLSLSNFKKKTITTNLTINNSSYPITAVISDKSLPWAIIELLIAGFCATAFIYHTVRAFKTGKSTLKNVDKNNKIKTLLSNIRGLKQQYKQVSE